MPRATGGPEDVIARFEVYDGREEVVETRSALARIAFG
jgi:hypothetical protein